MELVNLKDKTDSVTFCEAVKKGLGKQQGLYFPEEIAPLENIETLLAMPLVERSVQILTHLIGDELPHSTVADFV